MLRWSSVGKVSYRQSSLLKALTFAAVAPFLIGCWECCLFQSTSAVDISLPIIIVPSGISMQVSATRSSFNLALTILCLICISSFFLILWVYFSRFSSLIHDTYSSTFCCRKFFWSLHAFFFAWIACRLKAFLLSSRAAVVRSGRDQDVSMRCA